MIRIANLISISRNHPTGKIHKVSLVITLYNYGRYLPETMKSIAAQTYRDFEVIVVNDGSTDDSLEVARRLLELYRGKLDLILVDQENAGLPGARNAGFEHASGEIFFSLDSDDLIVPDYIQKCVELLDVHPEIDIVNPGYRAFGASEWCHIPPDFDRDSLKYWDYVTVSSVYRRQFFENVGGYDSSLTTMEDWDLWIRAALRGFKFAALKEALMLYRRHEKSMLANLRTRKALVARVRINNQAFFDAFDIEWARRTLETGEVEKYRGKKALLITEHFPPDVGGAENFALELGIELTRLGYLVDVATLNLGRDYEYYCGLNVFEFDYAIGPYVFSEKPRFMKLQQFVDGGEYDLIICSGGVRNWSMWCLDELEKYPCALVPVINRNSIEFFEAHPGGMKQFVERLKKARAVIGLTLSGDDAEFYCENDIPFEIIPNAVNFVSPTVDFKKSFGIPQDAKLLLCLASYYDLKNQLWLVQNLRSMPGNWVLAMMGMTRDPSYYSAVKIETGGDNRFVVLPAQPRGVVAAALQQADLLLLPSKAEAFGRVVLEAMSNRLPWLASSNCSALKEVRGGKTVQLDEEFLDESAPLVMSKKGAHGSGACKSPFVEAVRELLSDPAERERLGAEGYQEWRDRYRWRDAAERYLEVMGLEPDMASASFYVRNHADSHPEFIDLLRVARKDNPLVSVLMPTRNRPDTLESALRTVLDQTYEHFEVIVINDGGKDVRDIIDRLDDCRIIYLNSAENRGQAAARNSAARKARGKYIAYLDDDDVYYPTHLETLVDALEASRGVVAYTDSYRVTKVRRNGTWHRASKTLLYSSDFDREVFFAQNMIPINCLMHTKDSFVEAGGFDEHLPMLEDWDMLIRLAKLHDFTHIKEITCEVNVNSDSSNLTARRKQEQGVVIDRINDKYDGLVYRSRDSLLPHVKRMADRFEVMKGFSLNDAVKHLEDALVENPRNPRLELLCARAYLDLGRPDEAREHLDRFHQVDREDARELVELEWYKGGAGTVKDTGDHATAVDIPVLIIAGEDEETSFSVLKQLESVTDRYFPTVITERDPDPCRLDALRADCRVIRPGKGETIGSINSALAELDSPFAAVLRGDTLVLEAGWLEHIIEFMRLRPDVGLVGLSGWHRITEGGVPDLEDAVSAMRSLPYSLKPSWRFTEVAAVDDTGWVLRIPGFELSDYCGSRSFDTLDLSMKYLEAGYRIYVAAIEHECALGRESPAVSFGTARVVSGAGFSPDVESARTLFLLKWRDMLPVRRGFRDEAYVLRRVDELSRYTDSLVEYVGSVETALKNQSDSLARASEQVRQLDEDLRTKDDALANITEHEAQLERALARRGLRRLKDRLIRGTR